MTRYSSFEAEWSLFSGGRTNFKTWSRSFEVKYCQIRSNKVTIYKTTVRYKISFWATQTKIVCIHISRIRKLSQKINDSYVVLMLEIRRSRGQESWHGCCKNLTWELRKWGHLGPNKRLKIAKIDKWDYNHTIYVF